MAGSLVKNIQWVVLSSLGQRVVSFGATIVLARLLSPSVFGLYALAFSVVDGFGLFKSLGIDSAIIQRKDNIERAANTAFFLIPLMGVVVYFALFFAAPVIGQWLDNQDIAPVLKALGIIFIFNCFARVPIVLLEKEMAFGFASLVNFVCVLVYSLVAVLLAWRGFGVWSLVHAFILRSALAMGAYFYFVPWRPRWQFDSKIAWEMFHFGKFLFLGSLFWYFRASLDKAAVGKLLGVEALGFYAIALNISNLVNDYIVSRVQTVLFPAFAKLQDDPGKLRDTFLRIFKFVFLFALPFGCGLYLLGGDFLTFVFGEKWQGAIPLLEILAGASVFSTLTSCISPLFQGLGQPRLSFWTDLLQIVLFFGLLYPLAGIMGLTSTAIATLVAAGVSTLLRLHFVGRRLQIRPKEMLFLLPIVVASTAMSLIILVLQNMIGISSPFGPYRILVITPLVMLVYGVTLFVQDRNFFMEIKRILSF